MPTSVTFRVRSEPQARADCLNERTNRLLKLISEPDFLAVTIFSLGGLLIAIALSTFFPFTDQIVTLLYQLT